MVPAFSVSKAYTDVSREGHARGAIKNALGQTDPRAFFVPIGTGNISYVPVSQLDMYSSISGVSSSIEIPIARSLRDAISWSTSVGRT